MLTRWRLFALLFLAGCAGIEKDCASCNADQFGADWLVVQFNAYGDPMNCWQVRNVSLTNEQASDGIFWRDSTGPLIHISGWYNHVQVEGGNFATAAKAIGVDLSRCPGGKYIAPAADAGAL